MQQRWTEILVGLFITLGLLALLVLAFKVSGLTSLSNTNRYTISAAFDDVSGLSVRAPVEIAGVDVGEVTNIVINPESYKAIVSMAINSDVGIAKDNSASASVYTTGLLGAKYISINPGFILESTDRLTNGGTIGTTYSAIVLEKLIGDFVGKKVNSAGSKK